MDQRKGKLMTVHNTLHPRDDIEKEKSGGESLALNIAWIHQFEDTKTTLKTAKKE